MALKMFSTIENLQIRSMGGCASCCYSTSSYKQPLTFTNIFSNDNKERVRRTIPKWPASYASKGEDRTARRSAVLIPMCLVGAEPSIIFTLRSRDLSRHRGEVCFPGGMEDEEDGGDSVKAALREAEEELAIPPERVDVWGTLPRMPGRVEGQTVTTPVLGFCDIEISHLKPNPAEVDVFFHRTIASLCDPKNSRYTKFRSKRITKVPSGETGKFIRKEINGYVLPVYPALHGEPYEHKIWGLTAVMLHRTLKILATSQLYKFDYQIIF